MADITTIRRSISKMSDERIDVLIQDRRAARRDEMSRSRKSKSRKKTKSKKSDKQELLTMLSSLSDEEKQKLKEQIQ